jgi:peptidoglycan/xylan/chitin deacetylase (PgdA/CDA1 family)
MMSPRPSTARRIRRRLRKELSRGALLWRRHGVALLYHRIAEPPVDPFELAVTPAHFAQHLEVLQRMGPCLSFDAFARDLIEGDGGGRRRFCVTFDDGYRDNLETAAPLLAAAGAPATVFVVSGAVGSARMFWWDALARSVLLPEILPESLALSSRGETRRWTLGAAAVGGRAELDVHAGWNALREPPRDARQALFLDLWNWMAAAPTDEAERLADAVADWAGTSRNAHPEDHPVSEDELGRLCAAEGIEIGGHTVTHPRLATLPASERLAEMRDSRIRLGALTGREIRTFAYPYGSECPETARLAAEAGYAAACTTRNGFTTGRNDPMRIPRLVVRDWNGDEFARRLRRYTIF